MEIYFKPKLPVSPTRVSCGSSDDVAVSDSPTARNQSLVTVPTVRTAGLLSFSFFANQSINHSKSNLIAAIMIITDIGTPSYHPSCLSATCQSVLFGQLPVQPSVCPYRALSLSLRLYITVAHSSFLSALPFTTLTP